MMTTQTLEALELRRDQLQAKLDARRTIPGYAQNVRAIELELASLSAEIDRKRSSDPEVA